MLNRGRHVTGAATVEFYLVALLALLPLCLGILQTCLLLVDNHHIDNAAFMAARSGATHQGDIARMRSEFARVMTPLFVEPRGLDAGNAAARVGIGQGQAIADAATFARIEILSPGALARADFGESRDGVHAIPSDSLEHRSAASGERSGLTLQQANMLRVRFTYCRPMIVPFVRGMMLGLLRLLDRNPANLRCYAAGRIPIQSVGTAPMQSDFLVGGDGATPIR